MARKSVLVVDESDLFREFLFRKLDAAGADVETAVNGLDGSAKIRTALPDLVIIDYHLTRRSCKEVLADKNKDPNASSIPVILTAQEIDKNRLLELVPFNIRRVLMKPLKIDSLYAALTELLGLHFKVDISPCVIEAHVNDDIVFIEIAQGLNRERIDMLRFKIAELLAIYAIKNPRVIVMLSDMDLSFVDGPNLELLLETLLSQSRAKPRHIKILSRSSFVRDFARGRKDFSEIEVVTNLQYAMDGLLVDFDRDTGTSASKAELAAERILSAKASDTGRESIELRFDTGAKHQSTADTMRDSGKELSIAVVDDDFVIQELVKTTFGTIDATVSAFGDGRSFLLAARTTPFDLVFLDIMMPGMDGFQVLERLKAEGIDSHVIILSALSQREAVAKAMHAGVKSYLVKPLKPDQILKKTLEILKANF
ncbi:MAG: response regulator [Spirochaetaceae bacterium]|nr:response regulator [Spirochaetaceae bacterium]